MKGLILVGGYGTRLRPLTLSVPKPLIHFCNRPMIEYQIRALSQVGVKKVILAVAYQPDAMRENLQALEDKYKVKIICSIEEEPLLTAGPLRLAKDQLYDDEPHECHPELCFVFNSDIICNFPLTDVLEHHLSKPACEGTICVTKIENPSAFGVVLSDSSSDLVQQFIEKPTSWVGDCINAGLYLLNRKVVDRIEPRPTSIERETFPDMARDKVLYSFRLKGYWADIGKPHDFLTGTVLYLAALREKLAAPSDEAKAAYRLQHKNLSPIDDRVLSSSPPSGLAAVEEDCLLAESTDSLKIVGNVLIHPTAKIGPNCCLGPDVTIGPGCVVGNGVRLSRSALMANVRLNDFCYITGSIIGWSSNVGKWVRIEGLSVLGQDVTIREECFINGTFILPNKVISESVFTPGTIIM